MPVRGIARVHNPPAAQLWVRICMAIKAGGKASGTNLIILRIAQRNHTAPDICLLSLFSGRFYTQYELSNAVSALLYRVSLSQVICSFCLPEYQNLCQCVLVIFIPKSTPCFFFLVLALVYVAVLPPGHLCCCLTICVVRGNLLCWMSLTYIILCRVKEDTCDRFLFISTWYS